MTEEQAREAAWLIKDLDAAIALNEKIHKQYKEAWKTQYKKTQKNGDCALNNLANIALKLQAEVVDYIRRDIGKI
jgi:hypothetical protein